MLKTVLHHFYFLVFHRCVLFRLTSYWKFFAESPFTHSTSSHILTSFSIHFYFYNTHTTPSISIIHTSPSHLEGKSIAQTPQESHSHFPTQMNLLILPIPPSISFGSSHYISPNDCKSSPYSHPQQFQTLY